MEYRKQGEKRGHRKAPPWRAQRGFWGLKTAGELLVLLLPDWLEREDAGVKWGLPGGGGPGIPLIQVLVGA